MESKTWTPLAAAAGIGAGLVFAGAAVARAMSTTAGLREDKPIPATESDEHFADGAPRAPVEFRPDPTAPVPPGDRAAFAPALDAPTLTDGVARDIPHRSAEASSDGMGTIGGLEAVGGPGNKPQAPVVRPT